MSTAEIRQLCSSSLHLLDRLCTHPLSLLKAGEHRKENPAENTIPKGGLLTMLKLMY
jgi:hypothetical protein